jgi:hypothetical protein
MVMPNGYLTFPYLLQSDSLESRQVYLRFAKPYVEDDVKTLDPKIEEIIPLKENR